MGKLQADEFRPLLDTSARTVLHVKQAFLPHSDGLERLKQVALPNSDGVDCDAQASLANSNGEDASNLPGAPPCGASWAEPGTPVLGYTLPLRWSPEDGMKAPRDQNHPSKSTPSSGSARAPRLTEEAPH